ncbi:MULTISPECIES: hypothetical protein [unclassified Cupriavidus]|uniref:hypothetical protein n=1 Tax=unclassified Cupriavidus TaxID=2640874 RepID=UPI001C002A5B|nr:MULTISPECIES: hypothetical protein [unclassified Cupriavidus]MCA3774591.1 hypothetical protein [Cutibacterium sp.]MCA3183609.1 hypothetical protein [Cupriavidus sp.]MCA3193348.1 hypothetical protein [Cupriavidus sp.]MCA3198150.1 hypothetical protein [Cupriavidus sp.]MCA3204917.1 hypothetical protein [Cupriavidus sp.]
MRYEKLEKSTTYPFTTPDAEPVGAVSLESAQGASTNAPGSFPVAMTGDSNA